MSALPATLFTDLDGTLLDHHDYGFDAALPALSALRLTDIPLVLTTSKTLPEAIALNARLDNPQAVIVENGGAICIPVESALDAGEANTEIVLGHRILRFSPSYAEIRTFIEEQRKAHGFALRGFGDMSTAAVVAQTGLSEADAALAKTRHCSEPFIWEGDTQSLEQFRRAARARGLRLTRGGRFHHLMGDTSKAKAMQALHQLFSRRQSPSPLCIALGDSENDREMLECADIAVIVRRHDGSCLDCRGRQRTLTTEHAGPAGWNAAVLQILNELGLHDPAT